MSRSLHRRLNCSSLFLERLDELAQRVSRTFEVEARSGAQAMKELRRLRNRRTRELSSDRESQRLSIQR